ncbi:MAG: 3-deoxy-7-phosphoheptulonate synthase [Spirochaetales bacterium]|nr:3-deoxy-7-phosphoheptulonate synthase [Spirochaetales bacterium]
MKKQPEWDKDSWKKKQVNQQPEYRDQDTYNQILSDLSQRPPLVFPGEVEKLKTQLALAQEGKSFILQGGDCVERFQDCNAPSITNKMKILLQMSVVLTHALREPVIRIGRMAGQYFKPRSRDYEEDKDIMTFRGDSINSFERDRKSRLPDPRRLLQGFNNSGITLNYIRAMIDGGFADLHHPYTWNLYGIEKTEKWDDYREIVERILDAIHFMESFGGLQAEKLGRIEFYVSHEGLHLDYETSLTRKNGETGKYYNLGAHMLWIGDRTRDLNGAHIEYFRGISNPVGVKIGPSTKPGELIELLKILNPSNEPGRLTLITRLGRDRVDAVLPGLIRAQQQSGIGVIWSCDPMHGNTQVTGKNIKTRSFEDILAELKSSFLVHRREGSFLSAVHFELTGEDVTECTGGAIELKDDDLAKNYQTFCDPRLNYIQSMEMAFLISKLLKNPDN